MSHAEVEELKEQLAAALSAQQTAERELERMRPIEAAAREFRLAWFDTMGCSEEREAVFRALDAASEGEKLCRMPRPVVKTTTVAPAATRPGVDSWS